MLGASSSCLVVCGWMSQCLSYSKKLIPYDVICVAQVNTKAAGKAAIHCACAAGNVDVLKVIMEFAPNVEVGVCASF